MKTIREILNHEWIFFDGGSGTLLQGMGLRGGEQSETWNLSHPDRIKELYKGYLNAGCTVFNTNTFGANRFHDPENLEETVRAGVRLAHEARTETGRQDNAYIALDIGPTGKLLEPMGDLSFDDAVDAFKEVIRYGLEEHPDLVLIETMSDSLEAKAALLAAKESCGLPVFITCTFDAKGKMLTGGTVQSLIPMLEGLGADAVGINCSLGPREMIPIIEDLVNIASVPVIVNPNAGLPETRHGRTVYKIGPEEFASCMKDIALLGVQGVGGCCGTTPEHIRRVIDEVSSLPFAPQTVKNHTYVTSYASAVEISQTPVIIGERINPTGKKKFQQALRDRNIEYVLSQGLEQEDAGADILDVNVGVPGIDEKAMMETVIGRLQAVTSLPLQIDSSDPAVLERAMRIYNGRPMINSVSGKQESMHAVFPIAKKYGALIVALCLDENGIPATADGRIAIAEKIIHTAEEYGIRRNSLIIDGLTMTISSDTSAAKTTLETIRRAKEELGCQTILGVSNVSFGLPQRSLVNANFLTMAMANGLSCAIMNPNNTEMMAAFITSKALLNHDPQCQTYIASFAGTETQTRTLQKAEQTVTADSLRACVTGGLSEQAVLKTKQALQDGRDPMDIINNDLIPALDEVGQGFEKGTLYLPQLLMSADAAKAAFAVVRESMHTENQTSAGRIIMATVKGDIHDIGKNIVKVLLENYGYDVIDLGKDVPPETIVDTAVKENIQLVGLSALMTTTVGAMEETIRLMRQKKPDTKIIVGGAVLTREYADQIGADAYGKDAMATVRYADSIFKNK